MNRADKIVHPAAPESLVSLFHVPAGRSSRSRPPFRDDVAEQCATARPNSLVTGRAPCRARRGTGMMTANDAYTEPTTDYWQDLRRAEALVVIARMLPK